MRALTFKEAVAKDVQSVFLNTAEFADRHTVKYNGQVYENIPVSLQDVEQTEYSHMKDDHTQGIFQVQAVLYCARSDLSGKLPKQGTWIEVSSPKNKRFFHQYQVGSAGEEMGMVRLELGRFAQ